MHVSIVVTVGTSGENKGKEEKNPSGIKLPEAQKVEEGAHTEGRMLESKRKGDGGVIYGCLDKRVDEKTDKDIHLNNKTVSSLRCVSH